MPEQESLREIIMKVLRNAFEQMLANLKDTPSRPVIIRDLTEAFREEEKVLGELCDKMEEELLAQKESYRSDFEEKVSAAAGRVSALLGQPEEFSLNAYKNALARFKEVSADGFKKMDQQFLEFGEKWRRDFQQKTTTVINHFHDRALKIMTVGVAADVDMEFLDPNSSPKH